MKAIKFDVFQYLDYLKKSKVSFSIHDFQNSLKQVKQIRGGKLEKRNIEELLQDVSK